ncbi:hypothetical protein LL266_16815, partial [Vibrio anguillarum]|uniref:hypothetical protein n=1 Tax=Vibrio anguillarum TaxID=55601 RepID=UPI001D1911D8
MMLMTSNADFYLLKGSDSYHDVELLILIKRTEKEAFSFVLDGAKAVTEEEAAQLIFSGVPLQ